MSQLKTNAIRHTTATSDAITLASDGTATAKITNNLSNRNLIINGAMNVAQYGSSSTSSGYQTVDRFQVAPSGLDEAATQAQVDVAAGTTPYNLGFRKAYKVTNGNQTSGAGAADNLRMIYKVEAQDLATSGWNYKSASSYITLSFWVKSSVAQNFYVQFRTRDTTEQSYTLETGALSADTWTKVTKTIPGNTNITFVNDNGVGTEINFWQFLGTDNTGSVTLNEWAAYSSSARTPASTSTWYTTNDATFELTGVQLEVGDTATDFEHRSYSDELARCQRYFFKMTTEPYGARGNGSEGYFSFCWPVTMRADPTLTYSMTNHTNNYLSGKTTGIHGYFTAPWTSSPYIQVGFKASAEL